MHAGLFHGYELTGSGSNEYVRYLVRSLVRAGHEVHVVCWEVLEALVYAISTSMKLTE